MAVKSSKISKSKRNNQKRNKLVKRGVIKKTTTKPANTQLLSTGIDKSSTTLKPPNKNNNEDEEESDQGEDLLGMVEEEDLTFLKNAITNKSYNIYDKIKNSRPAAGAAAQRRKKRTADDDDAENNIESQYDDNVDEPERRMKHLLPIKTRRGIIPQQIEDHLEDQQAAGSVDYHQKDVRQTLDVATNESDDAMDEYTFEDTEIDVSRPISTAEMYAVRVAALQKCKLHIGTLSTGLLESPEEKITNFRTLLRMLDDNDDGVPEVYFSQRKLVMYSLVEVFKDVLPSYSIKKTVDEGVKLKKDTLKLQKYEENLLQYYKKFLQTLEKHCFALKKKKGDTRIYSEYKIELGELAVRAMCDLLATHPYFNYSENIIDVIVLFLNHSLEKVRAIVKSTLTTIFKEDKKGEITLKILRIINQYLKQHAHNVHIDMLEVILVLNLKDVNLDSEREHDLKQKKQNATKHKLIHMSKKERKRKKKLQFLESEMLETKAEESRLTKQKNLTEITKIIFTIYFRILKTSTNRRILSVCLEGLAKFAHCINIDYYIDLVAYLDKLLQEDWLGYKEQLHCIQTVFIMLSQQGEALNLDPTRFYNKLYKDLLMTTAATNNSKNDVDNSPQLVLIKTLSAALIKRRKKNTAKRTIGFVKRLGTFSLQQLHNGTLASLAIIKTIMQLNKCVDILLDLDRSVGDGKFEAELDDPEYANASNTALYEMITLRKHYHPIVAQYAKSIVVSVGGEDAVTSTDNNHNHNNSSSLPIQYAKRSAEEIYSDFDMSEMAFNPAVPVPKKLKTKVTGIGRFGQFCDQDFQVICKSMMRNHLEKMGKLL